MMKSRKLGGVVGYRCRRLSLELGARCHPPAASESARGMPPLGVAFRVTAICGAQECLNSIDSL